MAGAAPEGVAQALGAAGRSSAGPGLPGRVASPRLHRGPHRLRHPGSGRHGVCPAGGRASRDGLLRGADRPAGLRRPRELPAARGRGLVCDRHHVGATISLLAPGGSPEYLALTAALALLAGLVSIVRGRSSSWAGSRSSSRNPCSPGFVFGLALLIAIKQIPKLLGIEAHGETASSSCSTCSPAPGDPRPDARARGHRHRGAGRSWSVACRGSRPPWSCSSARSRPRSRWASRDSASSWSATARRPHGALAARRRPRGGAAAAGRSHRDRARRVRGGDRAGQRVRPEARRPGGSEPRADRDRRRERRAGLFSGFPIGSSLSKSAANDRAGRPHAGLAVVRSGDGPRGVAADASLRAAARGYSRRRVVVAVSGMMRSTR